MQPMEEDKHLLRKGARRAHHKYTRLAAFTGISLAACGLFAAAIYLLVEAFAPSSSSPVVASSSSSSSAAPPSHSSSIFSSSIFSSSIFSSSAVSSSHVSSSTFSSSAVSSSAISSSVFSSSPQSSSSSSIPIPFYNDSSQMYWYYPLEFDYLDFTGQSRAALLNTSTQPSACTPRFVAGGWLNPCGGVNQGLGILPSALPSTDYTFALWMQPWVTTGTIASQGISLLGSNTSGSGYYYFQNEFIFQFSSLNVYYSNTDKWTLSPSSGVFTHAYQWAHLVFSIAAGYLSLYVNGTATAAVQAATSTAPNPVPLMLGNIQYQSNALNDYTFVGVMSHARLFNRALTSTEVQTLMAVDSVGWNTNAP